MKVDYIKLDGLRAIQDYQKMLADVKQALEQRMNLPEYSDNVRPVVLTWSTLMRTCLLVGLSDATPRNTDIANSLQITKSSEPLPSTFLTKANLRNVFEALIKLRYKNVDADWDSSTFMSKLMMQEVLHGRDLLMKEGGLDQWLRFEPLRGGKTLNDIPELNLHIGKYENGMDAFLDINSREIANTQILVAGTTGSGKSNLLAVLLNQIRNASSDTHYPVNFLLFDYKGEFSNSENAAWLDLFNM